MRLAAGLIVGFLFSMAACGQEDLVDVKNVAPKAVAIVPLSAAVGDVISCDGSQSSDEDGTIKSHTWDFGDGASGDGEVTSHIFETAGSFTVTLTVSDDAGATDSASVAINVVANQDPLAVIQGPDSASVNQAVQFSGSTSSDPDGTITEYAWYVSDGTQGDGATLDHTFTTAGAKTVTLTVTDDMGSTNSADHSIEIEDLPPDYSGTWNWFLVDESQRDLGGLCGSFQDSTLLIAVTGSSITITEQAGAINVDYTGTLTDTAFNTTNSGMMSTQRIYGTFTSATAFDGTYALDPGIGSCDDRAVYGIKVP